MPSETDDCNTGKSASPRVLTRSLKDTKEIAINPPKERRVEINDFQEETPETSVAREGISDPGLWELLQACTYSGHLVFLSL